MHQNAAFSGQSGHYYTTPTHTFFFIRLPNRSGKFSLSQGQWFEMCSQHADLIAYSAGNKGLLVYLLKPVSHVCLRRNALVRHSLSKVAFGELRRDSAQLMQAWLCVRCFLVRLCVLLLALSAAMLQTFRFSASNVQVPCLFQPWQRRDEIALDSHYKTSLFATSSKTFSNSHESFNSYLIDLLPFR